jgi:uncharacterized RDD family membrane protein YckC
MSEQQPVRPSRPTALPSWKAAVPHEARAFQGQRAGFVTRVVAHSIDFVLIALILMSMYVGLVVLVFVVAPTNFTAPRLSFGAVLGAAAFVSWTFFTIAWSTTGRSPGAKVMGVRVVRRAGTVMRLPGAALRAAFCLAFMPGLFWVIVSSQNRSLQDTLLRTSVIYDWTKRAPKHEEKPGAPKTS